MSIKFRCDCGKDLIASDAQAGLKAKCQACGAVVAIPAWVRGPDSPEPVADAPSPRPSPPLPASSASSSAGRMQVADALWQILASVSGLSSAVMLLAAVVVAHQDPNMSTAAAWATALPWLARSFEAAVLSLAAWTVRLVLHRLWEPNS